MNGAGARRVITEPLACEVPARHPQSVRPPPHGHPHLPLFGLYAALSPTALPLLPLLSRFLPTALRSRTRGCCAGRGVSGSPSLCAISAPSPDAGSHASLTARVASDTLDPRLLHTRPRVPFRSRVGRLEACASRSQLAASALRAHWTTCVLRGELCVFDHMPLFLRRSRAGYWGLAACHGRCIRVPHVRPGAFVSPVRFNTVRVVRALKRLAWHELDPRTQPAHSIQA